MAPPNLHTEYKIECPKKVDPNQINPECFQDFIPSNVRVIEVKGLTLNQEKNPCRWEITVQPQGDAEVFYDDVNRYLRLQIGSNKPRNTNLVKEKTVIRNRECYWIFEYEIICKCKQTLAIAKPITGF